MEKNEKNLLNESELEQVAGGVGLPGLMSFEDVTAVLKKAGDRAWACSEFVFGGGRQSNLHDHINWAEKATDNESRLNNINAAFNDMGSCPGDVKYCNLSQEDYSYIHDRLTIAKNNTWSFKPHIIA